MPKEKRNTRTSIPIRKHVSLIYVFLIIGIVFYFFISECNRRNSLESKPKRSIKAVVTNEKVNDGNSPVSKSFTYKYQFEVDGKEYSGKSFDEQARPGDSIEIEYVVDNPANNTPKGYYNNKE